MKAVSACSAARPGTPGGMRSRLTWCPACLTGQFVQPPNRRPDVGRAGGADLSVALQHVRQRLDGDLDFGGKGGGNLPPRVGQNLPQVQDSLGHLQALAEALDLRAWGGPVGARGDERSAAGVDVAEGHVMPHRSGRRRPLPPSHDQPSKLRNPVPL